MSPLQFLTLEVPLQPAHTLRDRIEAALHQRGQPLRWAITATSHASGTTDETAVVEAMVQIASAWV